MEIFAWRYRAASWGI